jgi:uncharacterized protein YwgA
VNDIVRGLDYLAAHYREWGITSLAVPPLGTGLGQLEWKVIGPTLFQGLSRLEIPVELYAPFGTPTDELAQSFLLPQPRMGQLMLREPRSEWIQSSWVALVDVLRRVEDQPYHWPIGRTTFQKMAFVAAREGLPLGLEFRRGSFGPFSPDIKPMQARLMNNGLIEEGRVGNMFRVRVGRTFKSTASSYASDLDRWEPIISKVSQLFMRLDTRRAEVLATVMYAADLLGSSLGRAPTERELFDSIMEWKQNRRPPFDRDQIATTIRELASMGWLDISSSRDLPLPVHASLDA